MLNFFKILLFVCFFSSGSLADEENQTLLLNKFKSKINLVNPWNHLNFIDNSNHNFKFAIISDRTGSHRPGVFKDAIRKLNLLRPNFVISIGDLIEGFQSLPELKNEWKSILETLSDLDPPFFFVPGNHDIWDIKSSQEWNRIFGRQNYSFTYGKDLFIVMNTEEKFSKLHSKTSNNIQKGFSDIQLNWLKSKLTKNDKVRWVYIFFHKPLWLDSKSNWSKFENVIKYQKNISIFAGHTNKYSLFHKGGHDFINLSTTGAGPIPTGPQYGSFDHVTLITTSNKGPIIANLTLDGIFSKNPQADIEKHGLPLIYQYENDILKKWKQLRHEFIKQKQDLMNYKNKYKNLESNNLKNLDSLKQSFSWKVTKPLRWVRSNFSYIFD